MLPASNDLSRMMARAIRDGSQYYTLSYTPTNEKADGSFRRIDVKLRNGNYRWRIAEATTRPMRCWARAGRPQTWRDRGNRRRSPDAADAERNGCIDAGLL